MTIFDSIIGDITSLFDGVSTKDILKGATLGYKALTDNQEHQETQQQNLLSYIERNFSQQPVNQQFKSKAASVPYGAQANSVDPGQIQKEWMAYLSGVADTKSVPGKRYSELN